MSCPTSALDCVGGVVTAPTDLAGKALGEVGGKVAGSVVQDFADACAKGADWAIENLLTAWLKSPDPDITGASSPTVWVQQRLLWLVPIVMLGAVLVGAWRLAITRRAEHGRDLAAALVRTVAVSAAAGAVLTASLAIGDAFTGWILGQSHVDISVPKAVALSAVGGRGFPAMLLILLGLLVILTQIVQFGLMMVRNAMIVLLAGVLPISAAASNTVTGKQWWSKSVAWLLAFTLYKPVAALIYATSFRMIGKDQAPTTVVSGVLLMVLAVLALPALLRFLVPATAAMASGNAGAMAGATLATGAALATRGMGGAAGGFGRAVPTSMPAMPAGARSGGGGGVPGMRAAALAHAANGMRGKGSGGQSGSGIVGGHEE